MLNIKKVTPFLMFQGGIAEEAMKYYTSLMPINNYGFNKKFGWLNDQFGISWQLNLPE